MNLKRLGLGVVVLGFLGGMVYLASLGCVHLWAEKNRPIPLSKQLDLTAQQSAQFQAQEKNFMNQKELACEKLCEKRAQLIQAIRSNEPDTVLLTSLTEEIGREQMVLERATLEHLLALRSVLKPAQQKKLTTAISRQLREACKMTACGKTSGCHLDE